MFWKSVVGKLAVTILLLVSFVLFILTVLLLNFFENFHMDQAKKNMRQTANKVVILEDQYEDETFMLDTIERVKDPSSRVIIGYRNGTVLFSNTEDKDLVKLTYKWLNEKANFQYALRNSVSIEKEVMLPGNDVKAMLVGVPLENDLGVVYVYESIDYINQTKAETTKIIFLAAMIAIILTTVFAFFLSTRITAPLIKLREAAVSLTQGDFDTKVPILAYDEIGELALAFNRMGRQLKFHVHALEQEKEQLKSIVDSMADGIITLNRNGEVLLSNPPANKFISDWNFEHRGQDQETTNQLPQDLHKLLGEVIKDSDVVREFKVQGRYWVILMTPLYDNDQVRGAVLVIRDMTEERTLDKLRKDFVANVSHELRTPISLMQGYSEAIIDDIADSKEEKNELAKIIHDESLRMGRLVNELLDLAQMESGQIILEKTHVQLADFINKVIKKFNRVSRDRRISLHLIEEYARPTAYIDQDRMEQVLTNLIDNAISHTNSNGKVFVRIKNTIQSLTIEVEDTGEGIPEADIPFVFERFYKADKSRARVEDEKGIGLGLSIAKNIIKAHDGNIFVKSKMQEGTIFTIQIPKENTE